MAESDEDQPDRGFSLVELVVAMVVLVIVMTALAQVLVSSLQDTAYARQRNEALTLANQAIEETKALGWSVVSEGMSASDLAASGDTNATGDCFEGHALDVGGQVGSSAGCPSLAWSDPSCLGSTTAPPLPGAAALTSPAPISPHQTCYRVNDTTYGVDEYVTGAAGPASAPLTATVVVSWSNPDRPGLADHVVTTTELSSCLTVGALCS